MARTVAMDEIRELSAREFARIVRLSNRQALQILEAGEVPGTYRNGKQWHVPVWGVRDWQARRTQQHETGVAAPVSQRA
jgi:hypothetical protein